MEKHRKILIIAYYYPPFNNGGTQRIINFKKYLPRFGYNVDIVTTDSMGILDNDNENGVYRFHDMPFLSKWRLNKFIAVPVKIFRRILLWLGFIECPNSSWKNEVLRNIEKTVNISSYDFILASFPPAAGLRIGVALSQKFSIPLIADYRDGLVYDPFEYVKISPFTRFRSARLERKVAEQATLHITVNEVVSDYFRNKYFTETISIPNGFDDEEGFPEIDMDLPEGFNVVYTGSLDLSRKTYSLSSLAKIIDDNPTVNFIFVGSYSVREKANLTHFENVFLYSHMDRKKVIPIQRRADILLLRTGDNPSGMSGKLFEYLFAHRPILHLGGENVARKIIAETNSGKSFRPDELENIHNFIENVRSGNVFFEYKGIEQYARREECKMLAQNLDRILEGGKI